MPCTVPSLTTGAEEEGSAGVLLWEEPAEEVEEAEEVLL